jgi:N-acetylmuramoyl-L-alanine amidase
MRRVFLRILATAFICVALVGWANLVLAAPGPDSSLSTFQTGPYAVANGSVYVRGGPGPGFYVMGVLSQNEIVPILGASADNTWWYVNTRFGDGWIAQFSVTAANTAGVAVRDPGPIGTVTSGAVYVRGAAGQNATAVGTITQGQQVFVVGRTSDGNWLQIQWVYGTGWVAAQYLSVNGAPAIVQDGQGGMDFGGTTSGNTTASVPVTSAEPYGIVSASTLNVRSGPGVNYASLGSVLYGEVLPIVGRTNDSSWYQVETMFGTGWVNAFYLVERNEFGVSPVTTGTSTNAAVGGPVAVVSAAILNLRSGPGVQYSSLGTLNGGEEGIIIGRTNDWTWWLITTRLGNGWVNRAYVANRGDISAVPYAAPGGTVAPAPGQAGGEAPQPVTSGLMAVVSTGALHIRSGPNSAFSTIGSVYAGTRLPIIGQSPDRGWWQVETTFGKGWVSKSYVIASGDTSAVPVVTAP